MPIYFVAQKLPTPRISHIVPNPEVRRHGHQ